MELFIKLETMYLVMWLFFLTITLFVTTRDFMPKVAFRRGVIGVTVIFAIFIGIHYNMTTSRMSGVKEIFNEGGEIICENKMRRTISQSALLSKELGWHIEGDNFVNPDFEREFFTARCVDYAPMAPKKELK